MALTNLGVPIFRRSFATVLAMLTLVLGVAPSVLDGADFGGELVVESRHDPGECPQAHDHFLCTLVGASPATPAAMGMSGPHSPVARLIEPATEPEPTGSASVRGRRSRAPPPV